MKKIFRTMLAALTVGAMVLACGPDNKIDQPTEPENPEIVDPENPENPDPENPDKPVDPENPENTVYYTEVTAPMEDWSGNYLITAKDDGAVVVLAAWDPYGQPAPGVDLNDFIQEDKIPAAKVDAYRSFIVKDGESYTVKVPKVGYIGLASSSNKLHKSDKATGKDYHWTFSWDEKANAVKMSPESYPSRALKWNESAPRFACYSGGQSDITLYKREVALEEGTEPLPDPDQPDQPEEKLFKVNSTRFVVDATVTTQRVHVTSNVSWKVEAGEGLTADKASGKDNQMVTFSFEANESETQREFSATISTEEKTETPSYTVTIVQKGATAAPVDPDQWTRVKYDYHLQAGDVIRLACPATGTAASDLDERNGYMTSVPATFNEDFSQMKAPGAMEFTLGGMKGEWTLTTSKGTLASEDEKTLSYKGQPAHWSIKFEADGTASVRCNHGRIMYNLSSPRFTVYMTAPSTQMNLVTIYKKNWTAPTENGRHPEVDLEEPIVSSISAFGVNLGQIYNNASTEPSKTGFQYSSDPDAFDKSSMDYIEAYGATGTDGAFYQYVDGLIPNTTYYLRSYVKLYGTGDYALENKTLYSPVVEFKTRSAGGGDNPGGGDDQPGDGGNTSTLGWFELPAIVDADNNGIHDQNNTLYYASHLCAGPEHYKDGRKARNYTVCYSSAHVCPMWVAAPRHAMYENGSAGRTEAYKADPKIPESLQYHHKDADSGCNNGHMLGSGERQSSKESNRQVYYFSNIAPQDMSSHNTGGGAWNNLEDKIDKYVCPDTLYQIIGCHFDQFTDAYGNVARPKKIRFGGRGDVSRPTMFYAVLLRTKNGKSGKAVTACSPDELQCVAFVISHEQQKGHKPELRDMMSVSDLEKITGFTYFTNVPNAPKDHFEAQDWL